jgi:hypothetical protein
LVHWFFKCRTFIVGLFQFFIFPWIIFVSIQKKTANPNCINWFRKAKLHKIDSDLVETLLPARHRRALLRRLRAVFVVPLVHLVDQAGLHVIAARRDLPEAENRFYSWIFCNCSLTNQWLFLDLFLVNMVFYFIFEFENNCFIQEIFRFQFYLTLVYVFMLNKLPDGLYYYCLLGKNL